jgi:eukaryotic-like serine/threonine-protein kinase
VPTTGDVIAGKYRVQRELGRGGMGVVLAAEHLQLKELVAVKMMLPHVAVDPVAVRRFIREGRSVVRIKSEHVARVLDVAATDGGVPFLVMEHLVGADLGAVLEERGPLPVRAAVDYVLQALTAISEAHALGIVHRDLKPQNLFLTTRRDGTPCVKVLDFGIATSEEGGSRGLTASGILVGSPQYMSPEQLFSTKRVDFRSDIWALGCVLYELLSKGVPFEATSLPDLLIKVADAPPTPLASRVANVPAGLDAIVTKCLEKDPGRRFADVGLLAFALAPFGSEGAHAAAASVARVLGSVPRIVHAGARPGDAGAMTQLASAVTAPALAVSSARAAPAVAQKKLEPRVIVGALLAAAALAVGLIVGARKGPTVGAAPAADTVSPPPVAAAVADPPRDPLDAGPAAPLASEGGMPPVPTVPARPADPAAPPAPPLRLAGSSSPSPAPPPVPAPAPAPPPSGGADFRRR